MCKGNQVLQVLVSAIAILGPDSNVKGAHRVIFEALAHLLAVCSQHKAIADQGLDSTVRKKEFFRVQ